MAKVQLQKTSPSQNGLNQKQFPQRMKCKNIFHFYHLEFPNYQDLKTDSETETDEECIHNMKNINEKPNQNNSQYEKEESKNQGKLNSFCVFSQIFIKCF